MKALFKTADQYFPKIHPGRGGISWGDQVPITYMLKEVILLLSPLSSRTLVPPARLPRGQESQGCRLNRALHGTGLRLSSGLVQGI